ncbi:YqcC family protein [Vibrio pectenicida]|uniref:YqcC family protein n=1 Tax=Vibrio pectenicida TaxID=62763 RepID=UPI003B9CC761
MADKQQLTILLQQLTQLLKTLQLWQVDRPCEYLLQSTQPFAVDTLEPQEWLQWVFIPKMEELIARQMPIPKGFCLAPYFEECWKKHQGYHCLIGLINAIDESCG